MGKIDAYYGEAHLGSHVTILETEHDWDRAQAPVESAFQAFETAGEPESQWFALHYLSQIASCKNDTRNSRKYAQRALDLLSQLQHNWETSLFESYVRRPDVSEARPDLVRFLGGANRLKQFWEATSSFTLA